MKARNLGWVLGANMAVACLMMQGCKAPKPGVVAPAPVEPVVVTSEPAAPAEVAPSTTKVVEVKPLPPPPVAEVKPLPPPPVAEVKPLPPPPAAEKIEKTAASTASTYTVRRGDTLSGISSRLNVKMGAILALNPGLNPNRIYVGRMIKVPAGVNVAAAAKPVNETVERAAAPAPAAANTKAPVKTHTAVKRYTGATKDHVVVKGDSLGSLAYQSGITIRTLKELNGLKNDNIRVGQKLKVPAEKQKVEKAAAAVTAAKPVKAEKKADAVKPAASAAAVSEPAAASVVAPAAPASAESEPAAAPVAPAVPAPAEAAAPAAETQAAPAPASSAKTYTVKKGDDIVAISISFGVSPSSLMDINNLKQGDELKVGQVLQVPSNAKAL